MSRLSSNLGNGKMVTSNEATLTIGSNGNSSISRPKKPVLNFNRSTVDHNTLVVGKRPPASHSPSALSRENSTVSAEVPRTPDVGSSEKFAIYEPVQLTVKFHEQKTSHHDVLVDLKMLPGAKEGDVAEMEPLESSSKKLYFIVRSLVEDESPQVPQAQQQNANSQAVPQAEVSILSTNNLQLIMDLQPRSHVLVRLKNKKDIEADVVELYFKDIYLSRGDMWIFQSMLTGKCIYKSQRISFMDNSIRTSVNGIYRNGKKVFSAYVGDSTKIVFRSESAKLTFLIQLSKEMWDFEESGEIIFHKLINSLFPKIFKKWQELGRHHLITIVLFTSVDLTTRRWNDLDQGELLSDTKDYYRVVVDQVNILLWSKIMSSLRLEFANFMKDIRLKINKRSIEGVFVPAIKGNTLEAVNLATTLVTDHFKDPDLRHTTNHFILITPGAGLFDVDYKLMIQTSRKMLAIDAALDIICLSQPPLHMVPLFRYKDFNFKTQHCIPSWIDVSFWSDSNQSINRWIPRCKIYEIQMMGVMENETSEVSIDHLTPAPHNSRKSVVEAMSEYDDHVFKNVAPAAEAERAYPVHPAPLTMRSDGSLPVLTKKKSWDSALTALKPHGLISAKKRIVSDAIASEDVVLGVTNSRSNITAFTSLLNLSKKPSATALFTTPDLPKLLKSASSQSSSKSESSSVKSDTDADVLRTVAKHIQPSSTRSVPIRQPTPAAQSAAQNVSHVRTAHPQNGTNGTPNSANSSLDSRFMSTSPSRIQMSQSPEHQRFMAAKDGTTSDKGPWNIMWTPVQNPSQAVDPSSIISLVNGRWEHVFPKSVKRRAVKWTSLSSPAALPVTTTHFPSDFHTNFTFKLYDIILNTGIHESVNSGDLMRDMIRMRLNLGFQIVVGDKIKRVESRRKPGGDANLLVKFVKHQKYEGSRIYMSFDDEIHRICIDYNGNINVQIYKRSSMASLTGGLDDKIEYFPKIRTRYDDEYCATEIDALANNPKKYNWNHMDQALAGYDDAISEESKMRFKLKFVILPADITENSLNFGLQDSKDRLSTEEIRLEGLRRLIATIYKGRYKSPEEIRRKDRKEELTPDINFYTGSLFNFLREQSGELEYFSKDSLFVDEESLHLSYDIKLPQLAALLQAPKTGINFVDRKWHWKTHQNCFLGLELVNWMVKHFDEVLSKEDAVAFGNKLMEEGLFTHVENRHSFLDGHYFYKLNKEYVVSGASAVSGGGSSSGNSPVVAAKSSDSEQASTGWFAKKEPKSPSLSESDSVGKQNRLLMTPVLLAQAEQDSLSSRKGSEGTPNGALPHEGTPNTGTPANDTVKKVILSRSLLYDVDPTHKSYKPELVTVHYDRVHNLEHCFHVRLEWLNTTTKFVDDTVSSWARLCERYGLRLVETPWSELAMIPSKNPFHSFVDVRLALDPWTDPEFSDGNGRLILYENRFFFHIFLLDRSGFLLDNRAAVFFGDSDNIDVSYSWGKPTFRYAQYIHHTGAYIAEIKDTGAFILGPNNAHIARVNVAHTQKVLAQNRSGKILDSQKVMLEFRQTCKDADKLREIFRAAKARWEDRRDIDEALFSGVQD